LLCREDPIGDRERERAALFGVAAIPLGEVWDRMVVLVDSYSYILAIDSFGTVFLDSGSGLKVKRSPEARYGAKNPHCESHAFEFY
jgi:hypothetical protein